MFIVKIDSLSISNNNLQIEIENTSQSLSEPVQSKSVTVTLPSTTMGIIDELADCDRRKKNLIVNNLPKPVPNNQSDSDAFAALCSSIYKSSFTIVKSLHLGKKLPNKQRPLLLCLESEEDKLTLLSHSYLLCHNTLYKNIYIAPNRT